MALTAAFTALFYSMMTTFIAETELLRCQIFIDRGSFFPHLDNIIMLRSESEIEVYGETVWSSSMDSIIHACA